MLTASCISRRLQLHHAFLPGFNCVVHFSPASTSLAKTFLAGFSCVLHFAALFLLVHVPPASILLLHVSLASTFLVHIWPTSTSLVHISPASTDVLDSAHQHHSLWLPNHHQKPAFSETASCMPFSSGRFPLHLVGLFSSGRSPLHVLFACSRFPLHLAGLPLSGRSPLHLLRIWPVSLHLTSLLCALAT
ncbi:hypothetical protein B0T21DRAFT_45494 [Apiosordaria backusii]|uniref:Uncharacterized protein n=1 Tax=Apiosordaria backusii TaxID=314023 RepID=A0AA40AXM9_9PEZI|nr:hypothetical protein B0T21DRAFT_45494 [Apiosordaria backusii]